MLVDMRTYRSLVSLTLLTLCMCCWAPLLWAQMAQQRPNEIIVQLTNRHTDVPAWVTQHSRVAGQATQLRVLRPLSVGMGIYLLSFDGGSIASDRLLAALRADQQVLLAQYNHQLQPRDLPNDPLIGSQWQHLNNGVNGAVADADMDSDEAWSLTTGGLTALGDTIVVAVLDDGCNSSHEDWGGNLWINYHEIPFNGIDDDENGYIDDYRGYNTYTEDDDISGGNLGGDHGTPVAGIVGARGNNGIGVSGVCQQVKVMVVVASGAESDAIAGYGYVLTQRQRYNSSFGTQGAFVVSTNASWGVNFGQAADAPIWCALYDSLGMAGILSAGATANANVNVDTQGDLPTSCPSDYLISVTNLLSNNTKYGAAGYGANSIDIGAYGQGAFTINVSGGYGAFSGTSSATPHVAGAVGLLYSLNCPQFAQLAKTQPAQAALLAKQYLMQGSAPNSSLAGITVSGGALNLYGMLQQALANGCDISGCTAPFSAFVSQQGAVQTSFSWYADPADGSQYALRYRIAGSGNAWTTATADTTAATIADLQACTTYEWGVATICNTDTSAYTTLSFTTKGCCTPPDDIAATQLLANLQRLTWQPIYGAFGYQIQYKPATSDTWTNTSTPDTTITLTSLQACTAYNYRIRTNCAPSGQSAFSDTLHFTTLGCGACTDYTYCDAKGQNSGSEWIGNVQIGNWENPSGNDGGYRQWGDVSLVLDRGISYPITLVPAYSGFSFGEYFKVWVDFNQNGNYGDDPYELIFDSGQAQVGSVTATFTVPSQGVQPGDAPMRVVMKYMEPTSSPPFPCGTFAYGEVEDYCAQISANPVGIPPTAANTTAPRLSAYATTQEIQLQAQLNSGGLVQATLYDMLGKRITQQTWTAVPGTQQWTLHLPPTISTQASYLLHVQAADGSWQQSLRLMLHQ